MRVDLADDASDGEAGEGDVIRSVESALGGAGADHLAAGSGHSRLWGYGGADRLLGRGGRDLIYGGSGNDRLLGGKNADELIGDSGADRFYGGAGNDAHLDAEPGGDWHACGPGSDYVDNPRRDDLVRPDCESVRLDFGRILIFADPFPQWHSPASVTFSVSCPLIRLSDSTATGAMSGTITIRESSGRRPVDHVPYAPELSAVFGGVRASSGRAVPRSIRPRHRIGAFREGALTRCCSQSRR